jgi:TIR domain
MPPAVFISYSHSDKRWKDYLVRQLGVLEREGLLTSWHDGLIQPGADWLPAIEAAMADAEVAIFIVSADFLNSKFIRRKEITDLLERRRQEGLRIIPLIARPCPWQNVLWLAAIQARPLDGKTLAGLSKVKAEQVLSDLAEEILQLVEPLARATPGKLAPRTSVPVSAPPGLALRVVPPNQLPPGRHHPDVSPPRRGATRARCWDGPHDIVAGTIVIVTGCDILPELFDRPTAYELKSAIDDIGTSAHLNFLFSTVMGDRWFIEHSHIAGHPNVITIGSSGSNYLTQVIADAGAATVRSGPSERWQILRHANRWALHGKLAEDTYDAVSSFKDQDLSEFLQETWRL